MFRTIEELMDAVKIALDGLGRIRSQFEEREGVVLAVGADHPWVHATSNFVVALSERLEPKSLANVVRARRGDQANSLWEFIQKQRPEGNLTVALKGWFFNETIIRHEFLPLPEPRNVGLVSLEGSAVAVFIDATYYFRPKV